jgi:hypothetical protein
MIVDGVIWLVSALLTPIFAALPEGSIASWFPATENLGSWLADHAYGATAFVPLERIAPVWHGVMVVMIPGVVVYKVANWVYRHIPQLGGFGPGSG